MNPSLQPDRPTPNAHTASPQREDGMIERLIGDLLLMGVVVSAALLVTGVLWNTLMTGHPGLDYTIQGQNLFRFAEMDMSAILTQHLQPKLMLNMGVVVLLFTPFLRVAASVLYFALTEGNWKYSLITASVFAMLAYSLLLH
jgi:uncharacterized membrane protein